MALNGGDFDLQVRALIATVLPREAIDELLAGLGHRLGVDTLMLDARGEVELRVDGDLDLTLAHVPGLPGLVVAAPIDSVPLDRPEILKTLMQANLSWPLTHGGAFVIPPGSDAVMLCRVLALVDGDAAELDRQLAAFVEQVRFWSAEVAHALKADGEARKQAAESVPTWATRV